MPEDTLDPGVEDELRGIWHFIAQDNLEAATRVIDAAYERIKALAANSGLGRRRRFGDPRLREVRSWRISGFGNYLVFYRAVGGGIQVIHVLHGARDIERLLGES
jgi:toxin ParE1/3/4